MRTSLLLKPNLRLGSGRRLLWLSQLLSVSRAVAVVNVILLSQPLKFGGEVAFLPRHLQLHLLVYLISRT